MKGGKGYGSGKGKGKGKGGLYSFDIDGDYWGQSSDWNSGYNGRLWLFEEIESDDEESELGNVESTDSDGDDLLMMEEANAESLLPKSLAYESPEPTVTCESDLSAQLAQELDAPSTAAENAMDLARFSSMTDWFAHFKVGSDEPTKCAAELAASYYPIGTPKSSTRPISSASGGKNSLSSCFWATDFDVQGCSDDGFGGEIEHPLPDADGIFSQGQAAGEHDLEKYDNFDLYNHNIRLLAEQNSDNATASVELADFLGKRSLRLESLKVADEDEESGFLLRMVDFGGSFGGEDDAEEEIDVDETRAERPGSTGIGESSVCG